MERFNSPQQIVLLFDGSKYQRYDSDIYCDTGNCYIGRLLKEKFSGIDENTLSISPYNCLINGNIYSVLGQVGQAKNFRIAIENSLEVIIVLTLIRKK